MTYPKLSSPFAYTIVIEHHLSMIHTILRRLKIVSLVSGLAGYDSINIIIHLEFDQQRFIVIFNSDTFANLFSPRWKEMCTFWLPTNRHLKRIFLIFLMETLTGTELDHFHLQNSHFEFESNFNWIINLWFTFWSGFLFCF